MQTRADGELLTALRAGDELAFTELVERYHHQLIRLAGAFVSSSDLAEEVAQETWLAVVNGVARFEGRSTLRTWLFQICLNRARTTGSRESRSVPREMVEPEIERAQFDQSGAWTSPPVPWPDRERAQEYDAELVASIRLAIDDLPAVQRVVVTMRDVQGLTSQEVCQVLSISEGNQRVLLHRGRSQVRLAVTRQMVHR